MAEPGILISVQLYGELLIASADRELLRAALVEIRDHPGAAADDLADLAAAALEGRDG